VWARPEFLAAQRSRSFSVQIIDAITRAANRAYYLDLTVCAAPAVLRLEETIHCDHPLPDQTQRIKVDQK
jgi:hypothetical protein